MNYKKTLLMTLLLAQAVPAHAALLAYEPFDYTAIAAGTPTTASGFSGTWTVGQGSLSAQPSTLNYAGLPTAAGSALGGDATRAYQTLGSPITSGTVYLSYLFVGGGNAGGNQVGLLLTGTTNYLLAGFGAPFSGTESEVGISTAVTQDGWGGGSGFAGAGLLSNTVDTHYILLELNLDTNNTKMWLDPAVSDVAGGTLGAANLDSNAFDLGSLTGVGYNGIASTQTIDEIRIGTSLAAVAGVPEPSTALLGALGGLALLRRRR